MHLTTALLQQAAEKTVRIDFAANPVTRDDLDMGIDLTLDQFGCLFEMLEMVRLRGELQLARREIVAIDLLVADQAFDGIDGGRIRAITTLRPFDAQLRAQRRIVLRDARIALAAVASRR